MNRTEIEKEVRRLQFEVWSQRAILWPFGVPSMRTMFDPPNIARQLGLEYELRERIDGEEGIQGIEAAGFLDRSHKLIAISTRFTYPTQRFTAAHEIGHYLLHPSIGARIVHRDRQIFEMNTQRRSQTEKEADYFAACLLVPLKLLIQAFEARFGSSKPLPLNETVAFHLAGNSSHELFPAQRNSGKFANAVARAQSFDRRRFESLADHFGVSASAMSIRLQEAGLVVD
jgi:Zn-dependent peptidase ImmA (M78 family)